MLRVLDAAEAAQRGQGRAGQTRDGGAREQHLR